MQPMQAPVSTTQAVQQPASFSGKFALFQSTRPDAKAPYTGRASFSAQDVPALIQYLQTTPPNERGDIEFFLSGFNNTARNSGVQYIGGYVNPNQPRQGAAVQYASQQVQQQYHDPAPFAYPPAQVQQGQAPANAWAAPAQTVAQGDLSKPPF